MSKLHPRLASMLLSFALAVPAAPAAQPEAALLQSLFDPGTNAQSRTCEGFGVALDGNIAVVGVPCADVGAPDSGLVKVYNATTGALLHTLPNPSPAASQYFGSLVAISGTRVVVGSRMETFGGQIAGSVQVYDLASAAPTVPWLTLTNPHPTYSNSFGSAVAVSDARLVVSSPADRSVAGSTGLTFVFDLGSAAPDAPVLTLTNPQPASSTGFGRHWRFPGRGWRWPRRTRPQAPPICMTSAGPRPPSHF